MADITSLGMLGEEVDGRQLAYLLSEILRNLSSENMVYDPFTVGNEVKCGTFAGYALWRKLIRGNINPDTAQNFLPHGVSGQKMLWIDKVIVKKETGIYENITAQCGLRSSDIAMPNGQYAGAEVFAVVNYVK